MRKILCRVLFTITVTVTVVFIGFMIYMTICGLWFQLITLVSNTMLMWFGFLNGGVFDKIFHKEGIDGSINI